MSQRKIPQYFSSGRKRKAPAHQKRPTVGESYAKQHAGVESVSGGVSVRVDVDGDHKHDVEISPIMRDSFEMEAEPAVDFAGDPVSRHVLRGNIRLRRASVYRRPYTVYARPRGTFRVRRYRSKFLRRPKA